MSLQDECIACGYHRIPAGQLTCIWCGKKLTPQHVVENERKKIIAMEKLRAALADQENQEQKQQ